MVVCNCEGAKSATSSLGSGLGVPTSCLAMEFSGEVGTGWCSVGAAFIHPFELILQPERVVV